ncbi:MAG TPA: HAD family hydrolase [bacterium]|nr:HAD family hydrolase [bacterium]
MALQALVFDLDGTLLDQEGAERDALQRLYERDIDLPSKPAYHAFLRDWRNVADDYLQRFLDNRMGFDEQRVARVQALYSKYGSAISPENAARLHQAYAAYYRDQWRAFDDTLPALRALGRRFKLAVITNGDGRQQRAKLDATGLSPFFADVLVSGEVKVSKPDPAIFRLSEKALGLPPEALAYIGDRLDVDVAGARAAAWTAVWLDRKGMPGHSAESGTLVAENLQKLDSLLP